MHNRGVIANVCHQMGAAAVAGPDWAEQSQIGVEGLFAPADRSYQNIDKAGQITVNAARVAAKERTRTALHTLGSETPTVSKRLCSFRSVSSRESIAYI